MADAVPGSASGTTILVVSDTGRMASDVATALRGRSVLCVRPRHVGPAIVSSIASAIVEADLRQVADVEAAIASYARLDGVPTVFVADAETARILSADPRFSARPILVRPLSPTAIEAALASLRAPVDTPLAGGVSAAILALTDAFADVSAGRPIAVAPFASASRCFVSALKVAAAADATLASFVRDIERHHSATLRHSLSVAMNAALFGLHLGLGRAELALVVEAALLHDIGKAIVPLEVLDKPGRLDPEELVAVRAHPSEGERLLKNASHPVAPEILRVVRHHHEYLDGSGYPDGLKEQGIPDIVRLMTVVDIFTALVEDRPYKTPMPHAQAVAILRGMTEDGKLDPAIVSRFVEMIEERG
ncbi:HD-GYP domain-containing protein [Salinarimonas chemoclinalis]|uniref:HD-GYP domain-containing protein n=1 Tax=Salinarimonas chemoclinalis TaxID=3241599 RepID=UPI003559086B